MEQARKKIVIVHILDILRKKSSEENPLSLSEIGRELEERDLHTDRKAVKRNLDDLIHSGLGFDILTTVSHSRSYTDPKTGKDIKNDINTGYYIEPEFDNNDLRYLVDSVLCARYLTVPQKHRIIEGLQKLAHKDFRSSAKYIKTLSDPLPKNPQLFTNLSELDKALERHKKISFQYCRCETDKQLHIKTHSNGIPTTYIVNPVQITIANGLYYIIGNVDWHDNLSSFRLDKIKDLTVLNEPAKPNTKIKGAEQVINPAKYPQDHIYMYSTEPVVVRFRAKKQILDEIMDRFGSSATFSNETETDVEVRVVTDPSAMRYWALQYATNVRILFPPTLVEQVKGSLQEALDSYS